MTRFHLSSDFKETGLLSGLEGSHELVVAPGSTLKVISLDTFDWRLHRAGVVLVEELGRGRRLVMSEHGREPYSITTRSSPRTAEDLPDGYLAERIRPLMKIRALLPVGAARISRREGRIENANGEMVARLRFESIEPLDRDGNPTSAIDTVEIRGGRAASRIGRTLGLTATAEHHLEIMAAARDRIPGDYSSKFQIELDPDQPAGSAVRTILLRLLDSVEANVQGTIDDIDTEFLHDLRVACRRTRSALTQLKGVLPTAVTTPFNTEFKWLGRLTGPLRDLDVHLLEMRTYRALLPPHARVDLDPLEDLIRSTRARALRSVVRALRSARFDRLVTNWRGTLETIETSRTPRAAWSTLDLANKRIGKAYRRILKLGGGLDHDPPPETLHQLRIGAKKLRYLLEFFRSLYAAPEVAARIKELKKIQDILGGFNDMEVQQKQLSAFARELHATKGVPTTCLLTLGRLAGSLEERQGAFRSSFHHAFNRFESTSVRTAFNKLVGGEESK